MAEFLLSTIDENAHILAKKYGLGLEIAEFCTAWNMDEKFEETDIAVRSKLKFAPAKVLHAPFNELIPCAVDKKARALAFERFAQAIALAKRYGAEKVVVHGGYHPRIYYPQWYVEQSVLFWKEFLKTESGVQIVLENVLEEDPAWLLEIVRTVESPALRLCLDIGHTNVCSDRPVSDWLEQWHPYLSHFHIHNNDGSWDTHSALFEGNIAMKAFLKRAQELCPNATLTLELTHSEPSVLWLLEEMQ